MYYTSTVLLLVHVGIFYPFIQQSISEYDICRIIVPRELTSMLITKPYSVESTQPSQTLPGVIKNSNLFSKIYLNFCGLKQSHSKAGVDRQWKPDVQQLLMLFHEL